MVNEISSHQMREYHWWDRMIAQHGWVLAEIESIREYFRNFVTKYGVQIEWIVALDRFDFKWILISLQNKHQLCNSSLNWNV